MFIASSTTIDIDGLKNHDPVATFMWKYLREIHEQLHIRVTVTPVLLPDEMSILCIRQHAVHVKLTGMSTAGPLKAAGCRTSMVIIN